MNTRILTENHLQSFEQHLYSEEKSAATIGKYLRDVRAFFAYTGTQAITKEIVLAFKNRLVEENYAVGSINTMLASLNSLFNFLGWQDCKVRNIRQQRQTYCAEDKELSKDEYMRLLKAAENQPQLCLIMKTICGTGIRVSELQYFTVEAVRRGEVTIRCKGKTRTVLIPNQLKKMLLQWARENRISEGAIFITRNGKPVNMSNIWAQMKKLCE